MLTHRGFSAWIVINGKAVPEYLVAEDSRAHRVSCWIPSEEGQPFTVYWRDHGGNVDSCAYITLDGYVVPGRFLFGEGIASRSGVRTSHNTERPFMFKRAPDDGEVVISATEQGSSKDIGMIILRIKRVERLTSKTPNPPNKVPDVILGKRKFGELSIGFGDETNAVEQYPATWNLQDYGGSQQNDTPSTFVTFVFRYRTREFLESQGILTEEHIQLPKPPAKKPLARRTASLPLSMSVAVLREESEESPAKKQRLMEPPSTALSTEQHKPTRPRIDKRRAVSLKVVTQTPVPESISWYDPATFAHTDTEQSSDNSREDLEDKTKQNKS